MVHERGSAVDGSGDFENWDTRTASVTRYVDFVWEQHDRPYERTVPTREFAFCNPPRLGPLSILQFSALCIEIQLSYSRSAPDCFR